MSIALFGILAFCGAPINQGAILNRSVSVSNSRVGGKVAMATQAVLDSPAGSWDLPPFRDICLVAAHMAPGSCLRQEGTSYCSCSATLVAWSFPSLIAASPLLRPDGAPYCERPRPGVAYRPKATSGATKGWTGSSFALLPSCGAVRVLDISLRTPCRCRLGGVGGTS